MAGSLAPGFLVAAPNLADPNFSRSVVLLVDHRAEGSLGFVVNRPASIDFGRVARELELSTERGLPRVPVMVGGPVSPNVGWLVFGAEAEIPCEEEGMIEVNDRIRVSASQRRLEELALHAEAESHMLVLGYAGWGPGQLDEEIREGSWIPVDLDEQVVFETPFPERWDAALSAAGIDPRHLVGAVFGRPT